MNTVAHYLDMAVAAIDDKWGAGSAQEFPQIVAALIHAGSNNALTEVITHSVGGALDVIGTTVDNLGDAVRGLRDE